MKLSNFYRQALVAVAALMIISAPSISSASPVLFQAAGTNASSIQTTVDDYRAQLGTLNPNLPGSFGSGRREINWDAVPETFSSPNAFPGDFFNGNVPGRARGAVFSTPGTGFEVSANAGTVPVEFGNINPAYPSQFQTFSPQKLFTPVGSNVVDVNFFVPGTNTAATVSGFGAVFTDVDLSNTTLLEFFGTNGDLLFSAYAPASPGSESLSFLGVFFDAGERVGRVRITNGNSALGPVESGDLDLVVMDDFIYGEPEPVPEPATMVLLGTGIAGIAAKLRRRRRANNKEEAE